MSKQLGTEFKVGVFTIVALATLGYMLFVLNPNMLKDSTRKHYYTILSDAAGIIPKTQVKTNGVTVGKVSAVELDVNSTRIIIDVDANIKVPVGSTMEVRTRGLLGDVYLEIVRVADSGKYIEEGGLIVKSQDQMDMQGVMSLIGKIGKDVKQVTGTLANVMGTPEGESSIRNIIQNIETLTADLKKTGATIRQAVGDRPQDFQNIVSNLDKTLANLRQFSGNLNDVLDDENKEKFNRIIARFDESMGEVKGATKNIRLISEKIEKGEGTLGRLVNDDSTLNEIEGAVKDIREALGATNKMQVIVDGHLEARRDATSQSYVNILLKTRPDRYYLLGLTSVNETVIDTTTETVDSSGPNGSRPGTTKVRERINETKSLRFNVQMAKSWYNITGRLGVFESSGGVGVDFYFFRDALRLSLEAFDWKLSNNEYRRVAHFKSYANILFFDHIYLMAGLDDLTRTRHPWTTENKRGPVPMAGLGLAFNDQDLRSILGVATMAK